jgi:arylsulfatase A-like enzyme
MTFTRGFDAFHWSRGSEADFFWRDYYDERAYAEPTGKGRIRIDKEKYRKIWAQRQRRVRESDWITPQTYEAAIDWLTRNYRRENFFLYIDTFDPHEPWDPPLWLTDLYTPDYDGEAFSWAEYGSAEQFGKRELAYLQALYAAECTMVDRWFGRLVDTVDLLGIAGETVVIFTSDHGHYLGYPNDGGQIGKWTGYRTSDGMMAKEDADVFVPLLDSVSNPVLVVRHPDGLVGAVRNELAQPVDIMSTIFDCFSIDHPDTVTGSSILPLIHGEKAEWRETAVTADHRLFAQITDGRWLYGAWAHSNPPKLFDKQTDPDQTTDVLASNLDVAGELHAKLIGEMRQLGAPDDHVDSIDLKARYL